MIRPKWLDMQQPILQLHILHLVRSTELCAVLSVAAKAQRACGAHGFLWVEPVQDMVFTEQ